MLPIRYTRVYYTPMLENTAATCHSIEHYQCDRSFIDQRDSVTVRLTSITAISRPTTLS